MDSQKQFLATLKAVAGFSDGVVWRIPLNIRNKFSQNNQKVELKSHCSDIINYGAYNRSTNRESEQKLHAIIWQCSAILSRCPVFWMNLAGLGRYNELDRC